MSHSFLSARTVRLGTLLSASWGLALAGGCGSDGQSISDDGGSPGAANTGSAGAGGDSGNGPSSSSGGKTAAPMNTGGMAAMAGAGGEDASGGESSSGGESGASGGATSEDGLLLLARVDVNAQPFFEPFVEAHGAVYFAGLAEDEPTHRLWRTDGTPEGTRNVDELETGMSARSLVSYAGRVYFVASATRSDTSITNGLYRTLSDGSAVERFSGVTAIDDGGLGRLVPTSTGLHFEACTDTEGCEVWRTDGIAANMVEDLCLGSCSSSPRGFFDFSGTVFFTGTDGSTGRELYRTFGPGLNLVEDMLPGAASGNPGAFVEFQNQLYFAAAGEDAIGDAVGNELWRTSGAQAALVHDLLEGPGGSNPIPVGTAGGKLLVIATGDINVGAEPYVLSGSTLQLLADLRPGSSGSKVQCAAPGNPWNPNCAQVGSDFYFFAQAAVLNTALYMC